MGKTLQTVKIAGTAALAVYSSFTFLFMLALHGDQPCTADPRKGRCSKFFNQVRQVADESRFRDSLFAYRYDAGHSAAMVCTNEHSGTLQQMFDRQDDKYTPTAFNVWGWQANDWTTGGCPGLTWTN